MEIRTLSGGRIVGVNSDKLPIPLYADEPATRIGASGTVITNLGVYVQLNECARRDAGKPEPTMAKVMFRDLGPEKFLLIAPAYEAGLDVYELKFENTTKAPTIRGLKPLFAEARIQLREDLWYEAETEIVNDEDLGHAVAINWAAIRTRPRSAGEPEAAADEQPHP